MKSIAKTENTFTPEEIGKAYEKIKTGADFPRYVRDLRALGIIRYSTAVTNGQTSFTGNNGYSEVAAPKYAAMPLSGITKKNKFLAGLREHQSGKTDFLTLCRLAADCGVERWEVDTQKMTCTYYDDGDSPILVEQIPG